MKKILNLMIAFVCVLSCAFVFSGCVQKESKNEYTVIFYNYDGSELDTIDVKEDTTAISPTAEKTSDRYNVYVFDKWLFEDGSDATSALNSVKSNLTVYASFTETQPVYSINFYDNDGTTLLHTNKVVRGYATPINPTVSAKQDEYFNLEFKCWLDSDNEEWVSEEIVSDNINIYASYNIVSQHTACPVKFYDSDRITLLDTKMMMNGDVVSTDNFDEKSIEIEDGINYLYEINYWITDNGTKVTSLPLQRDPVLYAVYKETFRAVIDSTVTTINAGTFESSLLTSVTIPKSVTTIKYKAFTNCTSFIEINYLGDINEWVSINFGNKDFNANPLSQDGVVLKIDGEVVTTANITTAIEIKSNAFYNYDALTSVTIGKSVTSIGRNAIYNSRSEKIRLYYLGDVNDWVLINFANSDANPLNGEAELYINNQKVTSINITTTTEIKPYAFYGYGLTSVTIGESVTSIGRYAFSNSKIRNLTIGEKVTFIADYAFYDCNSLSTVVIPNSVTTLSPNAFSSCDSLQSLTIGSGLTVIEEYAFGNCNELTTLIIPNNITTIERQAFYQCGLTHVTMPVTLTSIGDAAFDRCLSLKEVNYLGNINEWVSINFIDAGSNPLCNGAKLKINDELVTEITITNNQINSYAFEGCTSLVSVTLGDEVTYVGDYVFSNVALQNLITNSKIEEFGLYTLRNTTIDCLIINSGTFNLRYTLSCVQNKLYCKGVGVYHPYGDLTNEFTKQSTSDKTGYDMYVRNAE